MGIEFISAADGRARKAVLMLISGLAVLLLLASCGSGGRDAGGLSEAGGVVPEAVVVDVDRDDDGDDAHEEADEHATDEHEAGEDEADEHEADEREAGELAFAGDAERGLEAYRAVGCSACHGQDGEGTEIGPALANHTAEQVRAQVRSPRTGSIMPAFAESLLGDDDLEAIIAFVASLEGEGHGHLQAAEAVSTAVVEMHHWMAISAVKVGNVDEARHHVGHIIEAVEGEHLAAMEEVLGFIEAGDMHSAEHDIAEMLAATPAFSTDMDELHLQLALQSTELGKAEEAEHHLTHFADGGVSSADAAIARAAAEAAASGDLDEAERVIRELLEETESGDEYDVEHAEPEGDAEADEAEPHAHAEEEEDHVD